MANTPISNLPVATALSGTEQIPIVQAGTTSRTTTGAIATLVSLGDISQLSLANPASSTDLFQVLQGSTGPGTGSTRKMTLSSAALGVMGALNVKAYGAVGDGATNDTVAIQAAMTAAAAAGLPCYVPPGTYRATALTWPSGLKAFVGAGMRLTTIKRLVGATTNASVLNITAATGWVVSDMTLDGDKATQTLGSSTVILQSTCSDCTMLRVRTINSKAVSGGYGAGIILFQLPVTNLTGRQVSIIDCESYDNDAQGINVSQTGAAISIKGGVYSSNLNGGVYFYDGGVTPAADVVPNMTIQGIRAERNTGGGIVVLGFFVVGLGGVRTYGHGSDPVYGINILGNQCNENTSYGIIVQATGVVISGNVCRSNGGGGSGDQAGICGPFEHAIVSDNICSGNAIWGIDAGGSFYTQITNNQIYENTRIGLNLGACQQVTVSGNTFRNNPEDAIGITRYDAGSNFFPWMADGIFIDGNTFINTISNAIFGVRCIEAPDNIHITNNRFIWPDDFAQNAIRANITTGKIRGNVVNGKDYFIRNSAALLVFAEWCDTLYINSDTTPITSFYSFSQNASLGQVITIVLSALGSGYTSAPTITITGGGGASAAATAQLTQDGRVAAARMTNFGTGYTSAPTIGFTGGGGTGAVATALVGGPNFVGREVSWTAYASQFRVTRNFTNIRAPIATTGTITYPATSTVVMRSNPDGNWYAKSSILGDGSVTPTSITVNLVATITSGTGTPEGVVTAPVGSLFLRTNGGAGTSIYVKESGSGNTGWIPK